MAMLAKKQQILEQHDPMYMDSSGNPVMDAHPDPMALGIRMMPPTTEPTTRPTFPILPNVLVFPDLSVFPPIVPVLPGPGTSGSFSGLTPDIILYINKKKLPIRNFDHCVLLGGIVVQSNARGTVVHCDAAVLPLDSDDRIFRVTLMGDHHRVFHLQCHHGLLETGQFRGRQCAGAPVSTGVHDIVTGHGRRGVGRARGLPFLQ